MTDLGSLRGASWIQHAAMAGVSNVRAKLAGCPIRINVCTLNVASLTGGTKDEEERQLVEAGLV